MTVGTPPLSCFTTSWDDGHPLDLKLADLLSKHGLPGTFYVPKAPIRQRLSHAQIRELSSRFEVGAHTLSHQDLSRMPRALAQKETVESKDWIEQTTGRPCGMFCFPTGNYRSDQLTLVLEAGYLGARTVEMMSLSPPQRKHGVLLLPTTIQAYPHCPSDYLRNIGKRFAFSNLLNYLRYGSARDWAKATLDLLSAASRRGGVFHLWGHSWEVEEQNQWHTLDELFAAISRQKHRLTGRTNGEICRAAKDGI